MSRILVAEDDPHILRLMSLWLTRQGHAVQEARNGLLAWEAIAAEPVDVLVTDVNMPGMDGLALVEQVIREQRARRGVVVLTNRWDHGEIRDRLAEWGVHVVAKPFSPSRLSELIDSLTKEAAPAAEPPAGS